jgi:hypothetical protein
MSNWNCYILAVGASFLTPEANALSRVGVPMYPKVRCYEVSSSDTLGTIAMELTGDLRDINRLALWNDIYDSDNLEVGQMLGVPSQFYDANTAKMPMYRFPIENCPWYLPRMGEDPAKGEILMDRISIPWRK